VSPEPDAWPKPIQPGPVGPGASAAGASAFDPLTTPTADRDAGRYSGRPIGATPSGRAGPQARPAGAGRPDAEEWAKPRRFAAYPTIRGRGRISPILVGFFALALVALLLFLLPGFLAGAPDRTPRPTVGPALPSGGSLAPVATPGPTPIVYSVRSGDTLSSISRRFGLTIDQIACFNNIAASQRNKLSIGQKLQIPPSSYQCGGSSAPPRTASPRPTV